MKNVVLVGSSPLNKDFLDARPPALVRLPRVETAYPKFIVHWPATSLRYGEPLRAVFFWAAPWCIAMCSVS